jgi:phosphatidylglycerophosphate synthase
VIGPPFDEEARHRIRRFVLLAIGLLALLQGAFITAVTFSFSLPLRRLLVFLALTVGYHLLFLGGLLLVGNEFRLTFNDQPLKGLNAPLLLSFLRFSSVPTVVFLFYSIRRIAVSYVLVPFLGVVFLTDLLDGILARRLKQTTRIGRILDASGDYLLILAISIVYQIAGFMPLWLFVLIVVRLGMQAAGIITLYLLRGYPALRLSFLGKASVFSIFWVLGFELLKYLKVPLLGAPGLVSVLEYIGGGLVAASLLEKVYLLARTFTDQLGRCSQRGQRGQDPR